jgi:phosphate transport system permease protein
MTMMKAIAGGQLATSNLKVSTYKIVAFIAALVSVVDCVFGALALVFNSADSYSVPIILCLSGVIALLFVFARLSLKRYFISLLFVAALSLISAVALHFMPAYIQGLNLNGIFHRSLFGGSLMLCIGVPAFCYSILHLFKNTPRGFDISRYPILLFFVLAGFAAYGIILFYIIQNGALEFHWPFFTTAYSDQYKTAEQWVDGWPTFSNQHILQLGILNNITGTLMLMGLTSLISLPIGVSVGIFVREYAGPKLGGAINFSTTALRSISGVILAITAVSLLTKVDQGTFLYNLFHGYGRDMDGGLQTGRSSFLFASVFISLLVIPIVAKATQEGLSTLPREVKEGSLALGATKEFTLFHVQLPWSLPNVVTGLMLGCAEAAGALAIIFLMSGSGQFGVSPTSETTSLAYLIFDMKYGRILGDANVQNLMSQDQALAALALLVMTLGLTAIALTMKRQLAKRYKGA